MIMEIEQLNIRAKTRGVMYDKEQKLLEQLLTMLDLSLSKSVMKKPRKR
jgi:hypothetical protein